MAAFKILPTPGGGEYSIPTTLLKRDMGFTPQRHHLRSMHHALQISQHGGAIQIWVIVLYFRTCDAQAPDLKISTALKQKVKCTGGSGLYLIAGPN